uniref:aldehyde dehydrogenase family protein n=1 Tax=Daejeonella sp. TaxID=2805397 RepID=UPI003982F802
MQFDIKKLLQNLGIQEINESSSTGKQWNSSTLAKAEAIFSPVDGKEIASVKFAGLVEYNSVIETAENAFKTWRIWPSPKRGDVIRQFGDALREKKEDLGKLVSYEMGKS